MYCTPYGRVYCTLCGTLFRIYSCHCFPSSCHTGHRNHCTQRHSMPLPSLAGLSLTSLEQSRIESPELDLAQCRQVEIPLKKEWRDVFLWLPQHVEQRAVRAGTSKRTRDYMCIECNYCKEVLRVPRERYPSLAARVIYTHVQKECELAPDVTPPPHRRKNVDDMRPSKCRARNQLQLAKGDGGQLTTAKHPLGSLIKFTKTTGADHRTDAV
jgi:hypothetical protein